MAPYIITVLAAAAILCGYKASLLPRTWRMLSLLPAALTPFVAQSWLLRQNTMQLEALLDGAPELETLCVIAVTQELFALAAGWPLIAGLCRFYRLRLLALAPSLLLIPGVLYLQFTGFLHCSGVEFSLVSTGAALLGWGVPVLLAELLVWRKSREERVRLTLNWEWIVLLLTLSLPSVARFQGFARPVNPEMGHDAAIWLGMAAAVTLFAILSAIRMKIQTKKELL